MAEIKQLGVLDAVAAQQNRGTDSSLRATLFRRCSCAGIASHTGVISCPIADHIGPGASTNHSEELTTVGSGDAWAVVWRPVR